MRQQVECGLNSVNDGELSKTNFTDYVRWRIAGYVERPSTGPRPVSASPPAMKPNSPITSQANPRARPVGPPTMPVCVEKLRYTGQAEIAADIANLKSATAGVPIAQAFLSANTPGTIEHWMGNEYYKSDEEFVFAIAEVMHEEYKASSMPDFCCRSTIRTCPTAGIASPGFRSPTIANTRRCGSRR